MRVTDLPKNTAHADALSPPPGVKDEARNLTPTAAFFIGCGLAEQLAARFGVPTTSLRVSVRAP